MILSCSMINSPSFDKESFPSSEEDIADKFDVYSEGLIALGESVCIISKVKGLIFGNLVLALDNLAWDCFSRRFLRLELRASSTSHAGFWRFLRLELGASSTSHAMKFLLVNKLGSVISLANDDLIDVFMFLVQGQCFESIAVQMNCPFRMRISMRRSKKCPCICFCCPKANKAVPSTLLRLVGYYKVFSCDCISRNYVTNLLKNTCVSSDRIERGNRILIFQWWFGCLFKKKWNVFLLGLINCDYWRLLMEFWWVSNEVKVTEHVDDVLSFKLL